MALKLHWSGIPKMKPIGKGAELWRPLEDQLPRLEDNRLVKRNSAKNTSLKIRQSDAPG
jgi:hypothetical protein